MSGEKSFPSKTERAKCWAGRDAFWDCMETKGEDASRCKAERKQFEDNCSNTWVKYFDRRRDYLKYKSKLETDGYEPITDKKEGQ